MDEILDEAILSKKEKPHVHFGVLVILLALFLTGLGVQRLFYSEVITFIGITALGSVGSWSLAVLTRCKKNGIVLLFIGLSILMHIYFAFEYPWKILIDSFESPFTNQEYKLFRVLIYFYILPVPIYFLFMGMKLREYKPVFIKKEA